MEKGRYQAFRDRHPTSRKIFILGMGRSGTHLLARSLDAHPQITASIEDRLVFPAIVASAIDHRKERTRYPFIEFSIRLRHAYAAPNHLVDKSHAAIWIAERLERGFPLAIFIGVSRDPRAVVASALRHPGVSAWHRNWQKYPRPNRLLGITEDLETVYDSLSLAEQLAIRWLAHQKELTRLAAGLGRKMLLVQYEDVINDPDRELARIAQMVGLESPVPTPSIYVESIDRWRNELDEETLGRISNIVMDGPESI